jgi:hypothetical protein
MPAMTAATFDPPAPAWPRVATVAVLVAVGLSTQFLFQREIYVEWSIAALAAAWLAQLRDHAICVGAIVVAIAGARRMPSPGPVLRWALVAAAASAGALAGEAVAYWLNWGSFVTVDAPTIGARSLRWLPLTAAALALAELARSMRASMLATRAATLARLELARATASAELDILQARIEPHFLFNTLATIRRLHEADAVRGQAMLASFIRYLRVALPHLRAAEVPLALELDLVTAYLDVVKARMNERLAFTIEAPAVLRSLAVPPLAVATLVENSVKHGIGVVADGGRIDIRASRDGDALIVAVCDTGAGLSGTGGSGSGLANLRARLNGLYGPAASIVLTLQRPKGARAELRVPARTLVPASTPATEA